MEMGSILHNLSTGDEELWKVVDMEKNVSMVKGTVLLIKVVRV